jgi:hypothetical protein
LYSELRLEETVGMYVTEIFSVYSSSEYFILENTTGMIWRFPGGRGLWLNIFNTILYKKRQRSKMPKSFLPQSGTATKKTRNSPSQAEI